jgi:transcriptional regulator with XRE-family HTH domain
MKNYRAARERVTVSVGESVRIIRELQGLSQNGLAQRTGISQATISAADAPHDARRRAADSAALTDMTLSSNRANWVDAFREELQRHVRSVLAAMPVPLHRAAVATSALTTLDQRALRIPARIYHDDPSLSAVELLAQVERAILACL